MTFYPATSWSLFFFLVLVILILAAMLYGSFQGNSSRFKHVVTFLTVWNVLTSSIVFTGLIERQFMPFGMILFACVNLTALYFSFSKFSEPLLNLPVWWLAAFQVFRLPLELILHHWSESSTVPVTMTWTGQNFDIVSGFLALLVFIPSLRNKKFIWVVNIVGIGLLANVLRVALLSTPVPFGWNLERPLLLIAYVPYHFIATVCVWFAIVGHIILTRKLIRDDPKI